MKILVINTGSSSLKFQLFDMTNHTVLAAGMVERIGSEDSQINFTPSQDGKPHDKITRTQHFPDHESGLETAIHFLTDSKLGVIADKKEITAIGHRVVHGGEAFQKPTLITDEVIQAIEEHVPLAPLHNPPNLTGIRVSLFLFPGIPQVAIFDTAFHQTLPPHAYHYAIPYSLYKDHKIRRYGFHGTSHLFVSKAAAKFLEMDLQSFNCITLHLGNGASVAAIQEGKCVDTSMGLTPLEGLIMGTRSGDLDPAIPFYLAKQSGMSFEEIDTTLNKKSGLYGICRMNDMRDIMSEIDNGNANAQLALDMYCYRIKKYIGAYYAALGRVDAIIFTAGIGENHASVRAKVCENLEGLGIELDSDKNSGPNSGSRVINTESSRVKVLVIPTNEELEIAEETLEALEESNQ